ncbi:Uma2 family endonuclease [Segniliparus rugosus]|uniref:Putative restriction endonuclease domain-containing protein n=1 Tax=Segniliparus rugosus (strain ATCC BAA-974 / DSM 45345 / CCUG 50838 / CIP 108380 / JCM 13579 / CDC 945) TaxID=679197 RepID=E5XUP7_SEGRC|nr:Uma2 family endonuclease [Segniliparus rugosus]EFV11885.1 hypothetical protein HMPREF9336_03219 [Segniliparus rugosus ATCC BAA-974]
MTTTAELLKVSVDVPRGPMTLEQWEKLELPEGVKAEVVEGVLSIMAPAKRKHMITSRKLANLLETALPAEWSVVQEAGVVLWEVPLTERIPDVVVYPAELDESEKDLHLFEGQALLVVEIVSPGSRRLDQRVKLQEYQDAGIPHYWIVDLDAQTPAERFLAYALRDGAYHHRLDVLDGDRVRITEPCELEFDLGSLMAR